MAISVNEAFCKLLIHNKLISAEQATENLEVASRLEELGISVPFSDLLVERSVISPKAAQAVRKLVEKRLEAPLEAPPVRGLDPTPTEDRKFGKLLVHNGLISDEVLEQALQTQKQMREEDGVKLHLGEILVGRAAVHLEVLESVLELQRVVQRLDSAEGSQDDLASLPTQHQDLQFAQMAIDEKLVSPEQIQDALRFQRELLAETGFPQRLGAVLLAQEVVTEEDVRSILETQSDHSRVGEEELEIFLLPEGATEQKMAKILAKHDLAPESAIQECLEIKQQLETLGLKRSLGEVLLMRGYIDHDQLQPLIKVQRETARITRRQLERKMRDRARKRRKGQEEAGTVPKRRSSRKGAARESRRGSAKASAAESGKRGPNPAMISAAILGSVLILVGAWALFGPTKGKSKDQQNNGTRGGKDKKPTYTSSPAYIQLKTELDTTSKEMGMLSGRMAREVLKQTVLKARKLGFEDLEARAIALGKKAEAQEIQDEIDDLNRDIKEVNSLLAKKRVLDAGSLLADVKRYFKGQKTEQVQAKLTTISEKVKAAESQAIEDLKATLDRALTAANWELVNKSVRRLSGYGKIGEDLVKVYESKLKIRKKEILDEQLARIRQQRRSKGQKRLSTARKELGRRQAARAVHLKVRGAQGRSRSRSRPLRISLRSGETYSGATIESVQDNAVTVTGKLRGKAFSARQILWTRMTPSSRARVEALTLTEKDSQEYLALGKFCITNGLYDDAAQLIRTAVQLDPTLKGKVPDVAEYRKPTTFASGKVSRQGNKTTIHYPFDDDAELEDFGEASKAIYSKNGELNFESQVMVTCDSAAVRPTVELVFTLGKAPPGGKVMLQVLYTTKKGYDGVYIILNEKYDSYLASAGHSFQIPLLLMATGGSRLKLKSIQKKSQMIRFLIDSKRIGILAGEEMLFDRAVEDVSDVQFRFMGFSRNPDAFFKVTDIKLTGSVSEAKYTRVIEEKRAWKLRQMDRGEGADKDDPTNLPVIGSEYSAQLAPSEGLPYREVISAVQTYLKQPDPSGRYMIIEAMERFEKKTKTCPAFYFYRGWFRNISGEYKKALVDFDRAVQLEPNFHEAMARKADVLDTLDRTAESARNCRQALELQPDYTFALTLLAIQKFYGRKTRKQGLEAIRQMEVAAVLAPKNRGIREKISQLRSVLKGPPWPRVHPSARQSARYTILTDLPDKQAKEMIAELERIQLQYRQFMPPREVKIRKGLGYIFATEATYLIYRELTLGAKPSHNTLGYYHPGYKHLHLFKDQEDTGTKTVAATSDTLRHEAWHMYVDNIVPTIPRYLNEGLAEYFGAMIIEKGKPLRHGIQKGRLSNLLKYPQWMVSTKTLTAYSTREFMTYPLAYPHAWAWVYMCLVHHPEKYKSLFMKFVEALRAGQSNEEALDNIFNPADFTQMDTDLKAMITQLAKQLEQ